MNIVIGLAIALVAWFLLRKGGGTGGAPGAPSNGFLGGVPTTATKTYRPPSDPLAPFRDPVFSNVIDDPRLGHSSQWIDQQGKAHDIPTTLHQSDPGQSLCPGGLPLEMQPDGKFGCPAPITTYNAGYLAPLPTGDVGAGLATILGRFG